MKKMFLAAMLGLAIFGTTGGQADAASLKEPVSLEQAGDIQQLSSWTRFRDALLGKKPEPPRHEQHKPSHYQPQHKPDHYQQPQHKQDRYQQPQHKQDRYQQPQHKQDQHKQPQKPAHQPVQNHHR